MSKYETPAITELGSVADFTAGLRHATFNYDGGLDFWGTARRRWRRHQLNRPSGTPGTSVPGSFCVSPGRTIAVAVTELSGRGRSGRPAG